MRQYLVLGNYCSGSVLRDHESAVDAALGNKEGRKIGELVVYQPCHTSLRDISYLSYSNPEEIHCHGNGLSVEIASADRLSVLVENDRVVGH